MKRLLILCVMALGFGATACGNACDDAVDKLDECGIDTSEAEDQAEECNEKDECAAECFNDASCSEIKELFAGMSNSLATCAAKCQ
jgi:hypothetical protein